MSKKEKKNVEKPIEHEEAQDEVIEGEIVEEGVESQAGAGISAGPMISMEEYNQLSQDLEKAQTQARDYFEGWQRERADFANYKRRVERDQQLTTHQIKGEIVKKYLTVLDDLDRALKNRPVEGQEAIWSNGIELIYRKLQNVLEAEGVNRIPAETEEFNPNRHEAISYEDSPDHGSGEIIEVVQQGYTLGDRVLRPALVRVARG
jgi:molecular chaperone GrpE